jgi:hypothetical protein
MAKLLSVPESYRKVPDVPTNFVLPVRGIAAVLGFYYHKYRTFGLSEKHHSGVVGVLACSPRARCSD